MKLDTPFYKLLLLTSIIIICVYIFRALKNRENFFDYGEEDKCKASKEDECQLDICKYDTINRKCKEIDYRLFESIDLDDESYKLNMVYRNVTVDDNIKPTEYSGDIKMAYFNGKNSYIYISDFMSQNATVAFYFKFNEFEDKETMPLFNSENWGMNLLRNGKDYYLEFNKIDSYGEPTTNILDVVLKDNVSYFLGVTVNKNKGNEVRILLLNMELTLSDNYAYKNGFKYNFLYDMNTDTDHIIIGTNNKRDKFFNGSIGKLSINRKPYSLLQLKRISKQFNQAVLDKLEEMEKKPVDIVEKPEEERTVPGAVDLILHGVNNAVSLIWSEPSEGSKPITNYTIIRIVNNKDTRFYMPNIKDCENMCEFKLENLDMDTNYKFAVVAINDVGLGKINTYIEYTPTEEKETPEAEQKENIYKISCNPDGTYSYGDNCTYSDPILSNLNEEIHKKLTEAIKDKEPYKIDLTLNTP